MTVTLEVPTPPAIIVEIKPTGITVQQNTPVITLVPPTPVPIQIVAGGMPGKDGLPGPPGTVPLVTLTQAEYDALATKDPLNMYVITDGADRTVLTGARDPLPGDGINGDYWINYVAWTISGPKASGNWPSTVSIIGPQGPPGVSGASYEYTYVSQTTEPPSTGQVRLNNANPTAATFMWIDEVTVDGYDQEIPLTMTSVGDTVVLQDKDESDRRTRYLITSSNWVGDYLALGLSWVLNGSGGTPPSGQRVLVHLFRAPGGMTQDAADARYVNVDGDGMTGPLTVQPPTLPLHPATLAYVNARTPTITPGKTAPPNPVENDIWIDTN